MTVLELFDAAAEALILLDTADAESTGELILRFTAVREHFAEVTDDAHPACTALAAAHRLAAGDDSAAGELERAFAEARTLAMASFEPRYADEAPVSEASQDPPESSRVVAMPLAGDEELLRDFGVRAVEHLDDADERLLALEADGSDSDAVDAVFRAFHTIKGMAGFLALDAVSEHAHASETLLSDARGGLADVSAQTVQALFGAVDRMRALVTGATGVGEMRTAAEPSSATTGIDIGADSVTAGGSGRQSASGPPAIRKGTVRVEEHRLDGLLDTIGEMVIAESMVSASLRNGLDAHQMAAQLERLDKITRELQQMATSLRMVPLRATFRSMTRLVRDLSHKAGKPVDFVVTGEDTEIDKEVADRIVDPLVHALRNAVDHGIESPDERRSAGKPEVGRVVLRAYHAGGAIHVEVSDDGRGLDPERIRARAVERGLMGADEKLDDAGALELLFAPGFSTAATVTDVSGRGVGMDVVRSTVEELRGRVELDSGVGAGTTVKIKLPVTLAIIDGMVARVGEERYVIPMLAIERSVRPTAEQVATVQGAGEMLVTDEGLVPIVRLHRLFSTYGAEEDATQAVIIITTDSGARAGLLACELMGQQQTVIKPLGDGIPAQQGVSGGAIMPDGRVGLILDAAGLVRLASERGGSR